MARFGRASGLRDLIGHGLPDAWRTGPRLADADYPDVLVARALTDGVALHCVLRPGAGPVRTTVVVDRLVPGRSYHVAGALEREVVADRAGCTTLTLDLGGRLQLDVEPRP